MGLVRKRLEVVGRSIWVNRGFHVDNISSFQLLGRAVQIKLLQAGKLLVDLDNAVAAMVSFADGDAFWVEKHQCSMESAKAGGIGQRWPL